MPYINLIFIIALTLTGIALLSFFGSGGIGVIFNLYSPHHIDWIYS